MRTKKKTIILAKIRRQLRPLARRIYEWAYDKKMEKDIEKISIKIYDIIKGGEINDKNSRKIFS